MSRVALYGLIALLQGVVFLWLVPWSLGLADVSLSTFPLDDAYIHHVYAEGLRYGDGLSYLPGVPAAGSTSPLFAFALVPLQLLPDPHWVLATKLIGFSLLWLVATLADRLVAPLAGERAASLAGILVASSPPLALAASSGMEVLLAAAFALLALRLAARAQTPRVALLLGLALAGAALTRPELGLLWLGAVGWVARHHRREACIAAAPALVALALWAAWNLHATSSPWPTTFLAKHAAPSLAARWRDLPWAFAAAFGAPAFALAAPLAALGGNALARRGAPLIGAFALVMPLGLAWAHDLREPYKLYWLRYALPVLPALLALVAAGVVALPARARRVAGAAALTLSLLGMLPSARHYAESCRNVAELNVAAAAWLDTHAGPSDWIASNDAGAVRRLTGRPVVDLLGLNDHLALRDRAARLQETRPRFYVVFPSWFPGLLARPDLREVLRLRSEPYAICERCEQSELVILEAVRP